MSNLATIKTPGVYIDEINAFPNSIVPVATAIPAFIGYTARADYDGKSCFGVPVRITSLQEFKTFFARLDATTGQPLPEKLQSSPRYYAVPAAVPATADLVLGGKPYDVEPDPGTIYHLYNAIKLFYLNGGGTCYVVSVGAYGSIVKGAGKAKSDPLINPNIHGAQLASALPAVAGTPDVTMIVVPDAVLLGATDNASLNAQILAQCAGLKSSVAILDVPGGGEPDPATWFDATITPFRNSLGATELGYGAAYYPFLRTSVVADADVDYQNLGDATALATLLTGANAEPLKTLLGYIGQSGPGIPSPAQIETALLNASLDYQHLQATMREKINTLPPSAAIAGVYTFVDSAYGVWHAPANVPLSGVLGTTLELTASMQSSLNLDALGGKSINALRTFPGKGVVVWGARTLDGNSQDWRYVNVRRTLIMIEQSMIVAMKGYVFQPNVANTWSQVTSMLTSFLTSLWAQGALVGATAASAFSVRCGLGSTMTSQDILNGIMRVSVQVAVTHPAEFIVITLQQQMATAS